MSSIGVKIDALFALREKKRAHEKAISELEQTYGKLEQELIQQLAAEGITSSKGKKASVSVTESIKPNVEDWEAFYAYIHRTKYYHLLERRPSVTGCRELFDTKGRIPGVVPFTKVTLNLRTAN